jgi:hypothetical protein
MRCGECVCIWRRIRQARVEGLILTSICDGDSTSLFTILGTASLTS